MFLSVRHPPPFRQLFLPPLSSPEHGAVMTGQRKRLRDMNIPPPTEMTLLKRGATSSHRPATIASIIFMSAIQEFGRFAIQPILHIYHREVSMDP